MRINVQNMLRQAAAAISPKRDSGAYRYVLEQLAGHLLQLRDRTLSGDPAALDEFFSLYVFDDGQEYSRPALTQQHPTQDQREALKWARSQNFGSVAARYAKLCAQAYDRQTEELAREVGTRSARAAEIDNLRRRVTELTEAARHWRTLHERHEAS
jgi:hypothetical protein